MSQGPAATKEAVATRPRARVEGDNMSSQENDLSRYSYLQGLQWRENALSGKTTSG